MTSSRPAVSTAVMLLILAAAPGTQPLAERPRVFAITGGHVVTAPGRTQNGATVVLRDGLIEAIGTRIQPPADAVLIDAAGKTVTAGFIDACSDLGQARAETGPPGGPPGGLGGGQGRPGSEVKPGAGHPISRIHPERRIVDTLTVDDKAFEKHRALGFTTALTLPGKGIFRGEAALINIGRGTVSENVLRAEAGQVIAFESGSFGEGYPTSLMGSIAAVRQTLLDAVRAREWSARYESDPSGMPRPDYVTGLDALAELSAGRVPAIFSVESAPDVPRALALAREFTLDAMVIGSGLEVVEQGAIDALRAAGRPVILPLAYPAKPRVDDPDEALAVTMKSLEAWDRAPSNPARLKEAGLTLALGTCRLDTISEFPERVRRAIDDGFTPDAALAALTSDAARILRADATLGTLEAGKIANVVVFDSPVAGTAGIFSEKSRPWRVFVDGSLFEIEQKKSKGDPNAKVDPRGTWNVIFSVRGRDMNRTWSISGASGNYSGTAETQAGTVSFSSVRLVGNEMTVVLPGRGSGRGQEIVVIITGDRMEGDGEFPGGTTFTLKGNRSSGPEGGER